MAHGLSRQRLDPGDVSRHGFRRFAKIAAVVGPSFRLLLPPRHRCGMANGAGQGEEIGGERVEQLLTCRIRGRAKAQHRVRAGYRSVRFNVGAYVSLHVKSIFGPHEP